LQTGRGRNNTNDHMHVVSLGMCIMFFLYREDKCACNLSTLRFVHLSTFYSIVENTVIYALFIYVCTCSMFVLLNTYTSYISTQIHLQQGIPEVNGTCCFV